MTVPYDPSDPSRSFLQTWTWSSKLPFFLLGTVIFFAPALWLAADAPLPAGVDVPGIAIVSAFASIFLLLGLYMFVNALRTYRWPTTRGVVRGKGISSSSGGEGGSTSYSPNLRYEYEVDGDNYESSRIAVGSGPSFSSRSGARDWLEEYPDDGEVTVHYNPRRPDKSVLERGGVLQGLLLLVITGGSLTVFVLLDTGNSELILRFLERLPLERLPLDRLPF